MSHLGKLLLLADVIESPQEDLPEAVWSKNSPLSWDALLIVDLDEHKATKTSYQ